MTPPNFGEGLLTQFCKFLQRLPNTVDDFEVGLTRTRYDREGNIVEGPIGVTDEEVAALVESFVAQENSTGPMDIEVYTALHTIEAAVEGQPNAGKVQNVVAALKRYLRVQCTVIRELQEELNAYKKHE